MSDLVLGNSRPVLPIGAQGAVVGLSLAGMAALALAIGQVAPGNVVALFGIGALLGVALYHASFGFTSAFRVLLADGQGAGMRAQMVMLGLACALFFPALGAGSLFGAPLAPNVSPLNVSLVVGAFLFGLGMQTGGGCASGTLFAVGGGSTRMVVTLVFFIVGSVLGIAHLNFWHALPGLPAVSLVQSFGWPVALALNLAAFAAIFAVVRLVERRRHGAVKPIASGGRLVSGPWPLVWGAVALAVLNFATLALAHKPWGVTSAFGLWGAKLLAAAGADVTWGAWASAAEQHALAKPLLADITSVMDFGIMLGALLAAGLAGKFAPVWRVPARQVLGSVVGGLLMGYGARLAYGCNIGAYLSGIASGSLHGWVWVASALLGSYAGLPLRPLFGMGVERTQTGC